MTKDWGPNPAADYPPGGMSEPLTSSTNQTRFTAEELQRYRECFAPIVKKYRARERLQYVLLVINIPIFFGALFFETYAAWFWSIFVMCFIVLLLITVTQASIECPACHQDIFSRELGSYCPECGAVGLTRGGWFRAPHCDSCGRSLRWGKTRQYSVRACNHCGLKLDAKGL